MGILNVTPDSFSDGGQFTDPEKALERALQMEEEGADIVDIGAESTRPGAEPVGPQEELKRLLPVLKKIAPRLKIPISIDTYKASVAEVCLQEGAHLINDISGLRGCGGERLSMIDIMVRFSAPVILMHMKGEPKTMQNHVNYENVISTVCTFFRDSLYDATRRGLSKSNILLDPGIGFGKRPEDNLVLINHLDALEPFDCPVVIGASRKSFVQKIVGDDPRQILIGSVTMAILGALHGASLLRVHDVKETKASIRLAKLSNFL